MIYAQASNRLTAQAAPITDTAFCSTIWLSKARFRIAKECTQLLSPIAGLEGTEGSALNKGQAEMRAFTITDNPSLGDYVVNGFKIRQRYRDLNRDPDSLAYIRSANAINPIIKTVTAKILQ